jgi:hypothetical protein
MHRQKRRISIVEIVAVVIAVALLGFFALSFIQSGGFSEKNDIARGVSNCRQIITSIRIHSSDHGGCYPDNDRDVNADLSTTNKYFRMLFQAGSINDESIFGCPRSPYKPDGKIGTAPDYNDALAPGENHWMATEGLSDSASGSIPLVYENAAVAEWNPAWNADIKGRPAPGRTWKRGIIIGMNDSSVAIQQLATSKGSEVRVKELGEGKNLFTQHDSEDGDTFGILDIER